LLNIPHISRGFLGDVPTTNRELSQVGLFSRKTAPHAPSNPDQVIDLVKDVLFSPEKKEGSAYGGSWNVSGTSGRCRVSIFSPAHWEAVAPFYQAAIECFRPHGYIVEASTFSTNRHKAGRRLSDEEVMQIASYFQQGFMVEIMIRETA
jgi:hypothetical protein